MSIRLMTYAFDTDLPSNEKFVLAILCDFANDQGMQCHPSMDTVARKTSLSKRQVQRVIKLLKERRLLTVLKNAHGGAPGATCHYMIDVAALKLCRDDILSPVEPVEETGVTSETAVPLLASDTKSKTTDCEKYKKNTTIPL